MKIDTCMYTCCNFKYICFKVCFQVCFQVCLLVIEGLYSYGTNNIIDRILHDIAIIAVNYYESYDYLYIHDKIVHI